MREVLELIKRLDTDSSRQGWEGVAAGHHGNGLDGWAG